MSLVKIASSLLISLFLLANAIASPTYPTGRIQTGFPAGDGSLVIYNYHIDEVLETTYRHGDDYNQKGLKEIQHVFRSRSDDKEHPIDVKLIELLDHLQDHFDADCIEIISGYRSPELNKRLKEEGASVAMESLHLEGRAADIHIDEVTEEAVAEYVRGLDFGGVGYYPAGDFIHIDTGDVKEWNLPDQPGRLLMAFRKGTTWQVITDRNVYLPTETTLYEITNLTLENRSLDPAPTLEIFNRGEWRTVHRLKYPEEKRFNPGETWRGQWDPEEADLFGKYRIIIPNIFSYLSARSNEFYRKRM